MALAAGLAELPDVAIAERSRYAAVLLDEYQDTGHAQVTLLARSVRPWASGHGGRRSAPVDLRLAGRRRRKHRPVRVDVPARRRIAGDRVPASHQLAQRRANPGRSQRHRTRGDGHRARWSQAAGPSRRPPGPDSRHLDSDRRGRGGVACPTAGRRVADAADWWSNSGRPGPPTSADTAATRGVAGCRAAGRGGRPGRAAHDSGGRRCGGDPARSGRPPIRAGTGPVVDGRPLANRCVRPGRAVPARSPAGPRASGRGRPAQTATAGEFSAIAAEDFSASDTVDQASLVEALDDLGLATGYSPDGYRRLATLSAELRRLASAARWPAAGAGRRGGARHRRRRRGGGPRRPSAGRTRPPRPVPRRGRSVRGRRRRGDARCLPGLCGRG